MLQDSLPRMRVQRPGAGRAAGWALIVPVLARCSSSPGRKGVFAHRAARDVAGEREEGAGDQQDRGEGVDRLARGLDRELVGMVDDRRGEGEGGLEEEGDAVERVGRE